MKRVRVVSAIVVIAITACFFAFTHNKDKNIELIKYNASFLDVFDTKTEIVGYGASKEEFSAQVEKLREKLAFYNNLYDIYNLYEGVNNIKTINDNAGVAPVVVDKEIIELLKYSKEMYDLTDGQVNIAMGSVLSIWHEYREYGLADPDNAKVPPMEKLQEAALHTDINQVIIDEGKSTVYLADDKMSLDVGGIGKGYAVQKVADYAKEIGMENALISVGGNVVAIGQKQEGDLWRLGIQNPDTDSDEDFVKKVDIKDKCLVTSGDYQRYYYVGDEKYCHIIDPDTLMPASYFAAVSIITEDSGMADALSTAVYNMSLDEGMAFINGVDSVEAMWVLSDGAIYYSESFEKYVVE